MAVFSIESGKLFVRVALHGGTETMIEARWTVRDIQSPRLRSRSSPH